jgi:hypothetical protein
VGDVLGLAALPGQRQQSHGEGGDARDRCGHADGGAEDSAQQPGPHRDEDAEGHEAGVHQRPGVGSLARELADRVAQRVVPVGLQASEQPGADEGARRRDAGQRCCSHHDSLPLAG